MVKDAEQLYLEGLSHLLDIKDSEIRILSLEQCREAVDRGIHAGGAFSAVIPLVALYYGGYMDYDVADPTRNGQDLFILSKGHAVASLASIYADLGYYDKKVLKNSRSLESILNGHPGPILPGIHISTGPLGQGIAVAQGFAIHGKRDQAFDVYCMTGDGELQEGLVWEAIMYSAYKQLDNFCVLVDRNYGQLDIHERLIFPMEMLPEKFESFGWNVLDIDAQSYLPVLKALDAFRNGERNGKPTAIICNTSKGFGSFDDFLNRHKVVIQDDLMDTELKAQQDLRQERMKAWHAFREQSLTAPDQKKLWQQLSKKEEEIRVETDPGKDFNLGVLSREVLTQRAAPRKKTIAYDPGKLPELDSLQSYSAGEINRQVLEVFAHDPKVISVDADLASTSGLEAGIGVVDPSRGLNVGVAEANMMNLGEAFAVLGYQSFVSTFCPFFDWKVLRRIAVGQQERLEDIASGNGWLNEGHGLDLCFVATAPNFETRTNGATHMGNDDANFFRNIGGLKIIDVSCPRQQIGILRWIVQGNKGLVYMRIMRAESPVLYDQDFEFDYGKAYPLRNPGNPQAWIISSGRGAHEALEAAGKLEEKGMAVGVADMPSIDEEFLLRVCSENTPLLIAEQNNGFIWSSLAELLLRKQIPVTSRIIGVNTLGPDGNPRFIHSGTYEELLGVHGLDPESLAEKLETAIAANAQSDH